MQVVSARIAPAKHGGRISNGIAVDLEHAILQVEDPVFLELCSGVEVSLALPVNRETHAGNLDREDRPGGVFASIVLGLSGDDRDVRLRLGFVVEPDGALRANDPAW